MAGKNFATANFLTGFDPVLGRTSPSTGSGRDPVARCLDRSLLLGSPVGALRMIATGWSCSILLLGLCHPDSGFRGGVSSELDRETVKFIGKLQGDPARKKCISPREDPFVPYLKGQ
jgi:hypothetical protein